MTIDIKSAISIAKLALDNNLTDKRSDTLYYIQLFCQNFYNFDYLTECMLQNNNTNWEHFLIIGDMFTLMMNFVRDDYISECELIEYATKCYGKAYLTASIPGRYKTANSALKLIRKSKRTEQRDVFHQIITFYNNLFVEHFDLDLVTLDNMPNVIKQWSEISRFARIGNMLEYYLYHHLYNYNKYRSDVFLFNKEQYLIELEKYNNNLRGLSWKEIKNVAFTYFQQVIECVIDEYRVVRSLADEDYWDECWAYDPNYEIIYLKRDDDDNFFNYA